MLRFLFVLVAVAVSNVATSCARTNVDFWGADLGSHNVAGFEACEQSCRSDRNCASITFRKSDSRCWLKYRRGGERGPSIGSGLVSMNMDCGTQASDHSCARTDVDFWGADLGGRNAGSFKDCETFCRDAQNCVSITFRKGDSMCWLKYRRGGERGPSNGNGLESLNMRCDNAKSPARCARLNTDFWGADLKNLNAGSMQKCEEFCRDTHSCVSFTFRQLDSVCWLKNRRYGAGGPSDAYGLVSMNINC